MNLKKYGNAIRYNTHLSHIAARITRPVQRTSQYLERQIRMKVWVNGGRVTFDKVHLNFPINVGVNYASLIFWNEEEGYEPDTWRALHPLLKNAKHFIDVGSNIGFYAVLARKINPGLRVDAFEPIPSIFRRNQLFHMANGFDTSQVWQIAASDADGTANIILPQVPDAIEEQATATLRPDSWQMRAQDSLHIKVPTRRLDTFFEEKPLLAPLVIKIDVEDFESAVLKGAEHILANMRPWIVCEILPRHHHNRETAGYLHQNSYLPFAICREGLFRFGLADFEMSRRFTDFVLIPEESLAKGMSFLPFQEIEKFFVATPE